MYRFIRRPSPATVIASLALLVALSGTGIAAVSKVLPRNSVGTAQLKNNAVTTKKVLNGTLLKVDFAPGQLPSGSSGGGATGATGAKGPTGAAGAKGPTGAAGAIGPSDAFSAYKDGPVAIPTALTTLASLSIPSGGKYVIFAKASLHDLVNTGVNPACRLVAGGDFDTNKLSLEGNSSGFTNYASVALNVVHEFSGSGTADLQCEGFGVNIEALYIKITAIKVGNLTNTGL